MNNETLESLKRRRSIRKYKQEQITDEELDTIIEAGLFAASGRGLEAPIIVSVKNPELVKKISKMKAKYMGKEDFDPYFGAPQLLLVFSPTDVNCPVEDASLVAGNMMVAAHSIGVATCWIHRLKEMFQTEEGQELAKLWNLPDNLIGVASLCVGYADCEIPEPKPRKEGRVYKF